MDVTIYSVSLKKRRNEGGGNMNRPKSGSFSVTVFLYVEIRKFIHRLIGRLTLGLRLYVIS